MEKTKIGVAVGARGVELGPSLELAAGKSACMVGARAIVLYRLSFELAIIEQAAVIALSVLAILSRMGGCLSSPLQ